MQAGGPPRPGAPGRIAHMDARERHLDTLLPHARVLAGLDDAASRAIELIAQSRYYTTGQLICRQGDPSDSVFVLRRGFARAFVVPVSGSAATMVARLCPGDVIGEVGVLEAMPRWRSGPTISRGYWRASRGCRKTSRTCSPDVWLVATRICTTAEPVTSS